MSTRQVVEDVAQAAIPIPLGVSGATIIGITVQDWVLIATAILLVFQLIIAAPKAIRVITTLFYKLYPNKRKPPK